MLRINFDRILWLTRLTWRLDCIGWWTGCSCEVSLVGISPTWQRLPAAVTGVRDFLCSALLCLWSAALLFPPRTGSLACSSELNHLTALQQQRGLFCYNICLCWLFCRWLAPHSTWTSFCHNSAVHLSIWSQQKLHNCFKNIHFNAQYPSRPL